MFGYSYNVKLPEDQRKLEVVQEEAAIVRMIYLMYLAGQSTSQIAGYLYNKGYKTRSGGKFGSKLVRDILRNQVYIGNIVWNKYHYDPKKKTMKGQKSFKNDPSKVVIGKGKHEAIISKEDFDAVQKKLERNRRGVAVRNGCKEYPFTGITVCGNCGHKMYGSNNVASRGNGKIEKRRYYRCSGKSTYDIDCHEISMRADDVESEMFTVLDVMLSNEELDDKRIFQFVEEAGTAHNEEIEKEISAVAGKLDENILKQERLSGIFTNGLLAMEAYKKQIVPLRDEEKQLKDKIRKLKLQLIEREKSEEYQKLLKAVVNHVDYTVEELDGAARKGLLRLVFKNIIIRDGRVRSYEMYPPFKRLYEGAWLQWQTKINQQVPTHPANVSTLRLTDDRKYHYGEILLKLVNALSCSGLKI